MASLADFAPKRKTAYPFCPVYSISVGYRASANATTEAVEHRGETADDVLPRFLRSRAQLRRSRRFSFLFLLPWTSTLSSRDTLIISGTARGR